LKRLLPIGLLFLLLYNTFGLTCAVLFFEKNYSASSVVTENDEIKVVKMHLPSLPYSGDLPITKTPEGLIRQDDNFYNPTDLVHENDTLYITLKSNQVARDHFVALADAMEMLNNPSTGTDQNPYSKAIKLFDNLLKNYLPNANEISFQPGSFIAKNPIFTGTGRKNSYAAISITLPYPPPECSVLHVKIS